MPGVNQVGDAAESLPLKGMDTMSNGDGGERVRSSIHSLSPNGGGKNLGHFDDDGNETVGGKVQDACKVASNWDLLVYYAKNSTMHGVPTIVGSELYRGRHVFWITVVCVMAMFLGTVIYWQMSDYYTYPTVTSVDIHYVGENDFPAITVCDPNYLNSKFLKYFVKDNYTLFHLTKLTEIPGFYHRFLAKMKSKLPEPPATNRSNEDIMSDVIRKSLRVLNSVKMNPLYCSWGQYHFAEPCPGSYGRVTEMGPCSTIDTRKIVKKVADEKGSQGLPAMSNAMRGLTLYFDTVAEDIPYRIFQSNGFKVVLHEPDEEPLPLSNGFLVGGDTTVEVDISKNVKSGLPPPYKAFGSGSCVDTEDSGFVNPLKRFDYYNKQVCEAECFIDFTVAECGGCRHFFHPGNESVCAVDYLAECFRSAEAKYYGSALHQMKCQCPTPCRQVTYSSAVSSAPFRTTEYFGDIQKMTKKKITSSISYVHFAYSDPVVTTMKQVAIYSAEGLLGNIGGQIGLFMGFSLITVAEMLELIFLLATRGRSLDDKVKRHKAAEAMAQAALQQSA